MYPAPIKQFPFIGACPQQRRKRYRHHYRDRRQILARPPSGCLVATTPAGSENGVQSPEKTHVGPDSPYSDISIDELEPGNKRTLELILMYHFGMFTATTFPSYGDPSVARMTMPRTVHQALRHEFLLHAIFSTAALHMVIEPPHWLGPDHGYDFATIHRVYMNMSIRHLDWRQFLPRQIQKPT